ncbi:MAG: PAS domain-containing protein [Acidobacteria bacterium]|nr:MAG: PAS domain-containing protein [Acidobacteriota bacterium]
MDEIGRLRTEIEELRRALAEAQNAIRAIQSGEVDALVVQTRAGERVFTLDSAYEPYRVFLDNMQQGAASLTADGLILYANNRFGEILHAGGEHLAGKSVYDIVESANHSAIERLLAARGPKDAEISLGSATGHPVHALLHVTSAPDGTRCAVLTDLTERVLQHDILASREWLRVTLTSIGDAVLSCDTARRVTFCNPVAEILTGWPESEALSQPIERIFRIVDESTGKAGDNAAARALADEAVVSLGSNAVLVTRDGQHIPVRRADP